MSPRAATIVNTPIGNAARMAAVAHVSGIVTAAAKIVLLRLLIPRLPALMSFSLAPIMPQGRFFSVDRKNMRSQCANAKSKRLSRVCLGCGYSSKANQATGLS